jgi:RimJ/RimL family protein N-acetyltransferase
MSESPEYPTQRLRLRQWTATDREPFAALNADPRVMEFFPATLSREQSDAVAARIESNIAGRGFGLWALEKRAEGEFIGFVGLSVTPPALPFPPSVEIGWRLAFEHWGKGYATEAARQCLRVGFQLLGFSEIVSFTAVGNLRSRAVMERLGMRVAGTFEHPLVPQASHLRRHCLYRLSGEHHGH